MTVKSLKSNPIGLILFLQSSKVENSTNAMDPHENWTVFFSWVALVDVYGNNIMVIVTYNVGICDL
jgi:hypothetical protein